MIPARIFRLFGTPGAMAGACVLIAVLALAALAPLLAPYDWNATSQCRRLAPMSESHWFGCDLFGGLHVFGVGEVSSCDHPCAIAIGQQGLSEACTE